MDKKLVIGLGSGRCGTVSLRELLKHQGFDATHELELMPWEPDYNLCDSVIQKVLDRDNQLVSDIGYYYLPYLRRILTEYPNVKCVCLKRDQVQVIQSFLRFSRYNYWSKPYHNREETEWDATFPTYDNVSKCSGISLYYDEYYKKAEELARLHPNNMRIFEMNEVFNERVGQRELFDFIGIEGKLKMRINMHANPPEREYKYV